MTSPQTLWRGNLWYSNNATDSPARAQPAATTEPDGPPPTTMRSNWYCIADARQISPRAQKPQLIGLEISPSEYSAERQRRSSGNEKIADETQTIVDGDRDGDR